MTMMTSRSALAIHYIATLYHILLTQDARFLALLCSLFSLHKAILPLFK
jgi:hypothetical protein